MTIKYSNLASTNFSNALLILKSKNNSYDMEKIKETKNVHHGQNIRLARTWKNMTQETLADKLDIYQTDISALEQKEIIDDEILGKIAKAMDVPVDFFKEFEPETIMNIYNQHESKIEINSAENSKDNVLQQGEQNITNYNYPLDKVTELYERLLQEKDKQIEELQSKLK